MIINYDLYLDGEEWPSESESSYDSLTKEHIPAMKPVFDMPPQYAASALHKLVRWARDGATSAEMEDSEERRVRSSNLGRFLARKALGIEDFALYEEHGVDRKPLTPKEAAMVLARAMFENVDHEQTSPSALARVAEDTGAALHNMGYDIYDGNA